MPRSPVTSVFAALFVCALFFCAGCGSGGSGDSSSIGTDACDVLGLKIFDGTTCSGPASPVVAVLLTNSDLSTGSCTGVLVSPTSVLTAGHCYCDPTDPTCAGSSGTVARSSVVVGGTKVIGVTAVKVHPQFRVIPDSRDQGGKPQNDVAILTLASSTGVDPLPIITSEAVAVGDILSIFGYGIDENGVSGVPFFNTPPTADFRLQSGQTQVTAVRDATIEALFSGDGSNPCLGDSGGPLILNQNGKLGVVGLTSVGISRPGHSCQPGEISIYTDLQDSSIASFVSQSGAAFR